jgi:protein SCO1/2
VPPAARTGAHVHGGDLPPADGAIAGMSLHHLDAPWLDQHGDTLRLADLAERVQVVALVYTTCGQACPRIVAEMKQIESAVPDAGFVLVSIDPERDTPEQLARFAEGARLDPARWTLLTGSDGALLELAAVLGVRYRRISETDFMHTNALSVLDRDGVVRHQQLGFDGVGATIDAVLTARTESTHRH